jgi:hypothetical protein
MLDRSLVSVPLFLALVACAENGAPPPPSGPPSALEISTLDGTTFSGIYYRAGSVVRFHSESVDQQRATLRMVVNGSAIDVELDLAAETAITDGHDAALFAEDITILLALRDALYDEYLDEVTSTLQGKLLARHTDRLADAPAGFTLPRRVFDLHPDAAASKYRADADGCGGDGATCFPGENGSDYAVFDPGNDGTCVWQWSRYGEDAPNCWGRCGAGCNWFDNDYTWDCLDHDKCVNTYGGSSLGQR